MSAVLLMLSMTACGTSGPATDSACLTFKPILVSRSDVLTDGTARAILTHNEAGERACGW